MVNLESLESQLSVFLETLVKPGYERKRPKAVSLGGSACIFNMFKPAFARQTVPRFFA